MSAQEAMNYGLVSKVFPTEDLVRERGRKEGELGERGRKEGELGEMGGKREERSRGGKK